MHGAAIADRILQITKGTFHVKAGALFPALHRLEQKGWIAGEWGLSPEGRRVKSYTITPHGERQLRAQRATWDRVVVAMAQVLESTS
jgi:DNA-binding PadR family transcriptional regulator